ncbi:hypothetical protein BAUCODRAFT_181419 [Baudoinia panamericana UAMH 10762]|uniref:Uncharacterized protein n=1 Tax=Baudoinia panamericana (strain UAMH 10762) TaxID=717646 RepID=M2MUW5_BAUPA|nr:uncharacterized protein BAUCODRAFT_181419 [Baudoinia panamericana UAMH 10762]EMD00742.1 hypothetical protein BAUCODRAFT_181419 [Baudoinia panamericana UAMH 10762]
MLDSPGSQDDCFESTLAERVQTVLEASDTLHSVLGLRRGSSLLGEEGVRLWKMPEPAWPASNSSTQNRTWEDVLLGFKPPEDGAAYSLALQHTRGSQNSLQRTAVASCDFSTTKLEIPEIVIEPPSTGSTPLKLNVDVLTSKRKRSPTKLLKSQHRVATEGSKVDLGLTCSHFEQQ